MAVDVDTEFMGWFNTHQPVRKIIAGSFAASELRVEVVQAIQREIKQAFTHGFARGVASEVARFPPDDAELGPIR